jgi:hypothetical protein
MRAFERRKTSRAIQARHAAKAPGAVGGFKLRCGGGKI